MAQNAKTELAVGSFTMEFTNHFFRTAELPSVTPRFSPGFQTARALCLTFHETRFCFFLLPSSLHLRPSAQSDGCSSNSYLRKFFSIKMPDFHLTRQHAS
jgi:hypothetical protein